MDNKEFTDPTFQRVYQYLRRYTGGGNLDNFKYQGNTEGSMVDCLKLCLQYVILINLYKFYCMVTNLGVVEYRILHGLKYTIL